jgi:uncharacterized protein
MTLISQLNLLPHPEGGHYREYYRSDVTVAGEALPSQYGGARVVATAIYFLLEAGEKSHLHRLKGDEIWHFYAGGALDLFLIRPDGQLEQRRLGTRLDAGENFQTVVPAGYWFAATPAPGSDYALCGCTMAPGFDFEDFELAERAALQAEFPQHHAFLQDFCLR